MDTLSFTFGGAGSHCMNLQVGEAIFMRLQGGRSASVGTIM